MTAPLNADAQPAPIGVNLIGYASANFSLGVTLRHLAQALHAAQVPFVVYDFPQQRLVQGRNDELRHRAVASPRDLPHAINLFCLSLEGLTEFVASGDLNAYGWANRLNVTVPFWELPVMPGHWARALEAFDVALCSSWFIRETIAASAARVLPIHMPYPLVMPEVTPLPRGELGIPERAFVFYFSFDPFSGMSRKNPQAVLAAFRQAFGDRADRHLLIKLNAPARHVERFDTPARHFIQHARTCSNVTVRIESTSYERALSICKASDCFVSLHRAEGLGMGPLEAMAMGVPTILTAWSGPMSYADATTAGLVTYHLVRPADRSGFFRRAMLGQDTVWAEASVDSAAGWMRAIADNTKLRLAVAQAGRLRARTLMAEAGRCEFVPQLAALLHAKQGLPALDIAMVRARIGRARDSIPEFKHPRLHAWLDRHVRWRFGHG